MFNVPASNPIVLVVFLFGRFTITSSLTVKVLVLEVKFKIPATELASLPMVNLPQDAAYPVGMVTVLAVVVSAMNTISPETGTEAPELPPDVVDQVDVAFQLPEATAYLKLPTMIFPCTYVIV